MRDHANGNNGNKWLSRTLRAGDPMYQAKINGTTISYHQLGRGEPLILLHGLGERKEGWLYQFALADQYELIIPDLRGHGQSEDTDPITIASFAQDVLSLMDHLGLTSAHICGLSMGGVVAQEMYRQSPHRCRSLILVNSFFYIPIFFKVMLDTLQLWKIPIPSVLLRHWAAQMCLYTRTPETLARFAQAMTPPREVYAKAFDACLTVDNRLLLRRIKVPTLIIGSQYDLLTPVAIQVMMHQRIPRSQLVILRGSGHLAKLEHPDAFNRILRRFLEEQKEQPKVS